MDSIYDKLEINKKPRVHIKYEVETEGGTIEKELPFVVGVMGDFIGNDPSTPARPLRERKFIQIDKDNFNQVMSRLGPGISFHVQNKLTRADQEIAIHLNFSSIEDFEPQNIVKQVPALNKLLQARNKLRDLLSKADRNPDLESMLEKIISDPSIKEALCQELDINTGAQS